ncbi:RecT family recombinase [Enterococcus faecium]|uniref:recombinase RecT n=1 Tax=Enterococcus faecium TaxID=1352 RepID=UPI000847B952|nr:RecT family recombinase [Enterococcus faecium]AOM32911.1 RecT protein [Enterococcus faecium]MCH3677628.1 recombinase RecT [Enterococcus faecium]MDN3733327.1 RecT family recombinase [Enterococcus faecium]MDW8787496.1 RecT family recombinase [Enterococcus faecium]MDW8812508.1 RecT family recombinase [Enterococcus faecium]
MANDLTQTIQRSLDEQVISNLGRLQEQGLEMPPGYSPQNALKSAFFELTNNTGGNLLQMAANNQEMKTSISNALLDMVIQGLSPAKKQCYFIKYGNKVQLMRSYFGTMAVLDRVTGGADITPVVVRQGDEFEVAMDGPNMVVKKHETKFENLDNEIIAAYVVIKLANGKETTTVMTKKQIDHSWAKSKMKGSGPQKEFPEEMAKRTVINRAAKTLINTSNDNDLLVQAAKDTLENEFDNDRKDVTPQTEKVATLEQKFFSNKKITEPIQKEPDPIVIPDDIQDEVTRVADVPGHSEIEQAHLIENEDTDPIQEELLDIPDFGREEGVDDVSEFEDDEYPF